MIRKFTFLIGTVFLIISLTACGESNTEENASREPKEEVKNVNAHNVAVEIEKEVLQVIKADEEAFNSRDIEKAMKNFTSELQTEEIRQSTTDTYASTEKVKLTLENKDTEVLYVKDKEALVKTTLVNRTQEFNAAENWQHDTNVIHALVKEEDGWKLSSTFLTKRVFLKEDGTLDVNNEIFIGIDNTVEWDKHIKAIKDKNLVPSEYFKENNL